MEGWPNKQAKVRTSPATETHPVVSSLTRMAYLYVQQQLPRRFGACSSVESPDTESQRSRQIAGVESSHKFKFKGGFDKVKGPYLKHRPAVGRRG